MHNKKFILHINAYFRDEGIFEEFGINRPLNQLFYFYFTIDSINIYNLDLLVHEVLMINKLFTVYFWIICVKIISRLSPRSHRQQ